MLTIRPLNSDSQDDVADVLRIFIDAPSYTQLVEGRAPSTEDVDDFFHGTPDGKSAADKSLFGFYAGSSMIGCADVIRAWPTDDCAWIGLLLFSEARQSQGYGKEALEMLAATARRWGCSRMQLAVVSTNARGFAFWQREGFAEIRRKVNRRFVGELIVLGRCV
ncbi:GNAT family N-acetyltransferase [Paraburkholderia sp. D15]|uniref:GNAT family N-acetyltransferase n=1 Tax=Paraburkholderia sp. D15 TaxID=2880218 RepID=UPI002478F523|nr:GNAT family N-acetyltransferase [Paraburkholderia sp. D15]WGS50738.1 GNAT family N-acetyltransferase [Paraburkholderia sp. D15]